MDKVIKESMIRIIDDNAEKSLPELMGWLQERGMLLECKLIRYAVEREYKQLVEGGLKKSDVKRLLIEKYCLSLSSIKLYIKQ